MMTAAARHHTVFWQTLLWPGMERNTLGRMENDQNLIQGTAIVLSGTTPYEFRYRIETDLEWQTRRVQINVVSVVSNEDVVSELVIEADDSRRWRVNNRAMPDLDGCVDIDLGFSPATNLLPIERLGLSDGETTPVRAAWLRFPELILEPLEQHYTRLNGITYRYESMAGRPRLIELDEDGMIVSYEGGWERLS